MKVSSTSLHYRYWNYWRNMLDDKSGVWPPIPFTKQHRYTYRPHTLCAYFWQVVAFASVVPVIVVAFTLAAGGIAIAISPIVGLIVLVRYLYFKSVERRERLEQEEYPNGRPPKPPREPSMLLQYVSAKKKKLCPIIELVEPKQ